MNIQVGVVGIGLIIGATGCPTRCPKVKCSDYIDLKFKRVYVNKVAS